MVFLIHTETKVTFYIYSLQVNILIIIISERWLFKMMTFGRYIKSINVHNWRKVAQNRDGWKKVVEQARTIQVVVL